MNQYRRYNAYRPRKRRAMFRPALATASVAFVTLGVSGYLWLRAGTEAAQDASSAAVHQAPEPTPKVEVPPPAPPAPQQQVHDYVLPPIESGMAPVISKIPTEQPVVFLTIDDGAHKDPAGLELAKRHNLKASLFLTYNVIRNNPDFFKGFLDTGSLVENHTMTHRILTDLSYAEQKQEICDQSDKMEQMYGRRPVLFRPPGGSYNEDTRRAVVDCGMKAVVMWSAKANGGKMEYQVGDKLRPGDIVLMHFRPEFMQDLQSFIDAMNAAGLRTDLLEDWTGQ